MTAKILTQDFLKECLHYDPSTGQFTWRVRPREHFRTIRGWRTFNSQQAGKSPRMMRSGSYLQISIGKTPYLAHRLAFLYQIGRFPILDVDHINHNRADNRWENLREVLHAFNMKNNTLQCNNTSGFCGIYRHSKVDKWCVQISIDKKAKYIGYFDRLEDALAARQKANVKHGYHENHGLKLT